MVMLNCRVGAIAVRNNPGLLVVMHAIVSNADCGGPAGAGVSTLAEALNEDTLAGRAAAQRASERLVTRRCVGYRAGSVLKQDSRQIGAATDAIVASIHRNLFNAHSRSALDQNLCCDLAAVGERSCVWQYTTCWSGNHRIVRAGSA